MGNQQVKIDPKGKEMKPKHCLNWQFDVLEEMKNNKRMLDRATRKIDRERTKIEGQEGKHMKEIQKLAKAGQHVKWFRVNRCIASGKDSVEGHCQNKESDLSVLQHEQLVEGDGDEDVNDEFVSRDHEGTSGLLIGSGFDERADGHPIDSDCAQELPKGEYEGWVPVGRSKRCYGDGHG